MIILAPISVGELVDKITILMIKCVMISDDEKLKNINREFDELKQALLELNLPMTEQFNQLQQELYSVNLELWHIENFKRACEKNQTFNDDFITAARNVYLKNDRRAQIKRTINDMCGSSIVEEKSHDVDNPDYN